MNNEFFIYQRVRFSLMFLMGLVIVIFPNSLLSILIFGTGIYMTVIGFNSMISAITLIKFRRGWQYDGFKAAFFLIAGLLMVFKTGNIAIALSGLFFVILGIFILLTGVASIVTTKEISTGILFIIIGLLIAVFPVGVSFFVTRIIGISLIVLSTALFFSMNSRSS